MKNHIRITFLISASLIFSFTAPASATIYPSENFDQLGSSKGNEEKSIDLIASVNQADRSSQGNILSVTWSIENRGAEPVVLAWMYDQSYTYSGPFFSGVTAISQDGATKYHPIMDGAGNCLCAGNTTNTFDQSVDPNETNTYWSLFSIPSDVKYIKLEIPRFDPIEDIPIS